MRWDDLESQRQERAVARERPLDDTTYAVIGQRRAIQLGEREAAGPSWEDNGLMITTRTGGLVLPRSYDRALALRVKAARVPSLTSHGLRHTAATHMVALEANLGELRAIADVLGRSSEMLMEIYAHVLPRSASAVVDRIAARAT